MKAILLSLTLALAAAAGLSFLSAEAAPARAADPAAYQVDGVHSTVLFRIDHGVGRFWGRFNAISGTIAYDEQDPSAASVEVEVRAEAVDTANAKRDDHVRSGDFLSAKEFPTIAFKSTKVERKGEGLTVAGDLTLHGVTRPVTVEVGHVAAADDGRGNEKIGFEGRFTIDRTDFGITYGSDGALGNEVLMVVSLEAVRAE